MSPDETEPTLGEQNALKSVQEYLSFSAFSHSGLVQQLEFEDRSHAEATYGADRCGANWFEQAAKSAADYLRVCTCEYGSPLGAITVACAGPHDL